MKKLLVGVCAIILFGLAPARSFAQAPIGATVTANGLCPTTVVLAQGNGRAVYQTAQGALCAYIVGGQGAPYTPTQNSLDVATVATGGTAVVAITAGHRTAGGVISNPSTATINLCVNEFGTASGTTTGSQSGKLFCLVPGQSYNLQPSALGVSVISSDSSHPFFGYGLQ